MRSAKTQENVKKLSVLSDMVVVPGHWQERLIEVGERLVKRRAIRLLKRKMPRAELNTQLGWAGAQDAIDKGMYKEFVNRFGVDCVIKTEETDMAEGVHEQEMKKNKTVDVQYLRIAYKQICCDHMINIVYIRGSI